MVMVSVSRRSVCFVFRTGIRALQNSNKSRYIFTCHIEVNLLEFNPDYPKNPKNLGERIKKARMDKGMTAKELAAVLGVSDTAVLNWEIKGRIPDETRMEKINKLLTS